MTDFDQSQLIIDLSRNIVAQTAPQELPLFRSISAAYFKNPEKTLRGQQSKDELLGFGMAESSVLLTPVVLEMIIVVLKVITDEYYPDLFDGMIRNLIKTFRSQEQDKTKLPPPLTPEQLKQVHQVALEKARTLLPQDQATLLADAVAGSFVVAS